MMILYLPYAGKLVLVSTLLDLLIPLHHPIIMLPVAEGHHRVQGVELVDTLPRAVVDITGGANQVSQDCVDSVTLATLAL